MPTQGSTVVKSSIRDLDNMQKGYLSSMWCSFKESFLHQHTLWRAHPDTWDSILLVKCLIILQTPWDYPKHHYIRETLSYPPTVCDFSLADLTWIKSWVIHPTVLCIKDICIFVFCSLLDGEVLANGSDDFLYLHFFSLVSGTVQTLRK